MSLFAQKLMWMLEAGYNCCYTVVTLLLHYCNTVVTLLLHYTVVTLLLHYCYTVVALMWMFKVGYEHGTLCVRGCANVRVYVLGHLYAFSRVGMCAVFVSLCVCVCVWVSCT
jgi:hypothetical protein